MTGADDVAPSIGVFGFAAMRLGAILRPVAVTAQAAATPASLAGLPMRPGLGAAIDRAPWPDRRDSDPGRPSFGRAVRTGSPSDPTSLPSTEDA